ncbi:type I-U CRISPR-associated protein Cas5/Cas6 [Gordonia iterans]|uniref:Type I-U CRISPR-associated protein Cas5/Cas6 n=1 Tax=Gordonia iterans TaxID=1004901 RepID=A0A2S0KE74_9ACTN|nr:type I-U CRISPR-associated protein Csb2 [Gordonia iterans]AVL99997.1 type I-U CRISPR-associated protein Cas5/Cas6 [Gordonia iterans]
MAVVGIRASFPLGVYRGHTAGERHDLLPSPLRLHSALVAAAGNGSSAVPKSGGLRRVESSERALQWLEDNPPEYVELPDWETGVSTDRPYAYMDEGVVENVNTDPSRRKSTRFVADSTALAGPIGWGWDSIPEEIASSLDELCADVPCLGETESPVVLEVREIEPTHRRSRSESPFASVAIRLSVPSAGRTDELDSLYERAQPARTPSVSGDKWKSTEKPLAPRITHDCAIHLGYDRLDDDPQDQEAPAPWEHLVHIAVDKHIEAPHRVQWAVAMHRALVAALGTEANSAVTGRYPEGARRPANRVAIQYVDETSMQLSSHAELGPGFALLVSDDALAEVAPIVDLVRRLYRGGVGEIRLGHRTLLEASTFWETPAEGARRLWCSAAVVPETRRQKAVEGRKWTLGDSALLSVGFVYRDRLGKPSQGPAGARYREIVDRVQATGAAVIQASPIPDSNVGRYAHKVPEGVVVQPYQLILAPGSLVDERGLVALGQSRHLGGGLLVPMDVEPAVADILGAGR